ncbi:MAG: M28 family peptidase [Bacteroidales bacterium]|nr:MAG: M28 family peptidase [Bacteroidales bacterium]
MRKLIFISILLVISSELFAQINESKKIANQNPSNNDNTSTPLLSLDLIKHWVYYMSSDSMKGRANGSPENKIVAKWLSSNYSNFGLLPFEKNDTYFQHYFQQRKNKDSIPEVNIIGYIPGNDPILRNEYIIISAHFDHIGIGKPVNGDSIYNGANDNASGVSAVLGIAKTLQMMKAKPSRSIVFISFSGEEIGMLGSKYFCKHPNFPITSTYLNINFELLGHCTLLGPNRYYITGKSYTNLSKLLNKYNKNQKWQFLDSVKTSDFLFTHGDNRSFATIKKIKDSFYGVPAQTFVIHNGENHVHRSIDEAKYFNFENLQGFIQYMSELTIYLSNEKKPIELTTRKFKKIKS